MSKSMDEACSRRASDEQDVVFVSSHFSLKAGTQDVGLEVRHAIAYLGQNFPKSYQGLFLWPAAQAMAEFSLRNRHMFADRRIMEIGAGVGMVGLAIGALRPSPERVVLTDGCQAVVHLLEENVRNASVHIIGGASEVQNKVVTIESGLLVWGQSLLRHDWKNSFDVVVGADLVYDEECDVQGLLQTTAELLAPQGTFLLGMMNRSEHVERWFEQQVDLACCNWQRSKFISEMNNISSTVIYTITWSTSS